MPSQQSPGRPLTDRSAASGRIVLFGATGYTGELTARAMRRRGLRPVLAGRRRDALEALADELDGLETAAADVGKPASVRALLQAGDVLVSTVGPFARWGDPALDAAIDARAHYLDSTGEPAFIRKVFERADQPARRAGSLLLTAMGYDWAPGNLAGALAVEEAGPEARGVRIGYFASGGLGGMSGGTRASAVGAMLGPGFQFRGGKLVTERSARKLHRFEGDGKALQAVSAASSEAFSLPGSYPRLQDVEVYLGWFAKRSRAVQGLGLALAPITRLPPLRAGLQAAAARLVKTSTGGPGEEARASTGSIFVAEALSGSGDLLARVTLEGPNGYTLTGDLLAWAAGAVSAGDATAAGALGPVGAFGLEGFEAGAAECDLRRRDSGTASERA